MAEREFLEPWEREVVLFIEKYHAVSGQVPDNGEMIQYINLHSTIKKTINEADIAKLKNDSLFKESMRVRGIIVDSGHINANLTPEQMAAAAVMTNLIDRRSDEKKLRDLGISTEQWATWMLDDKFVAYIQGRVEQMVTNSTHEAHLGLMKGVRAGNVKAIELTYKLTGRYDPEADAQAVNVRVFLGRVLEAVQRHVKDPTVLNALGSDLMEIGFESNPIQMQQNTQIPKPSIRNRPLEI